MDQPHPLLHTFLPSSPYREHKLGAQAHFSELFTHPSDLAYPNMYGFWGTTPRHISSALK